MAKIIKATQAQKDAYSEMKPLHPLFGFVRVQCRMNDILEIVCPVEDLCAVGKDNPKYEIIAPPGMLFDGELSSMLGFTQADLLDRLIDTELELMELNKISSADLKTGMEILFNDSGVLYSGTVTQLNNMECQTYMEILSFTGSHIGFYIDSLNFTLQEFILVD